MKKLIAFMLLSVMAFSYDIPHEVLKCSEIKAHKSRLMCFDVISSMLKPTEEESVKAGLLVKECFHCHGERWEIPTTQSSRAVRNMTRSEIEFSLLDYKHKRRDSLVMRNQLKNMSNADLALISKYIANGVSEERD